MSYEPEARNGHRDMYDDDDDSASDSRYDDDLPPRKAKLKAVEDFEIEDSNDMYAYPDRDHDKDRDMRRSQMSGMSGMSQWSDVVRRDIMLTSPYERTFYGQNAIAEEKMRPYFMILALLVNTALFVYTLSVADWEIAPYQLNPMVR